jgi:ElaB/YqjD/DUF883 family membrane-anchored ribosome-binding protein
MKPTMLLTALLCAMILLSGPAESIFALDVKEEVEDAKDKAKDVVDKGKEKAKDIKEKVADEDFWEKVPPYAALPAALLIGLVLGFILGKRGEKNKQK